MRQLVFAWMVILTGQSAASADDAAAPGPVGAHFLVAMRALVPAGELGGYEAFHLAVTRRWGTFFLGVKEESEHFGSGEGKISHESTVARWQDLAQDGKPRSDEQSRGDARSWSRRSAGLVARHRALPCGGKAGDGDGATQPRHRLRLGPGGGAATARRPRTGWAKPPPTA